MLKEKMKSYNFWISLASAILLVVRIVADKSGFYVDPSLVMDLITAICGVFVVIGIISSPVIREELHDIVKEEKIEVKPKVAETKANAVIQVPANEFLNNEKDLGYKDEQCVDSQAVLDGTLVNEQVCEIQTTEAEVIDGKAADEGLNLQTEEVAPDNREEFSKIDEIVQDFQKLAFAQNLNKKDVLGTLFGIIQKLKSEDSKNTDAALHESE